MASPAPRADRAPTATDGRRRAVAQRRRDRRARRSCVEPRHRRRAHRRDRGGASTSTRRSCSASAPRSACGQHRAAVVVDGQIDVQVRHRQQRDLGSRRRARAPPPGIPARRCIVARRRVRRQPCNESRRGPGSGPARRRRSAEPARRRRADELSCSGERRRIERRSKQLGRPRPAARTVTSSSGSPGEPIAAIATATPSPVGPGARAGGLATRIAAAVEPRSRGAQAIAPMVDGRRRRSVVQRPRAAAPRARPRRRSRSSRAARTA